RIIVICSPVQRSGPVNLGGIHIDAGLQERADGSLITPFRGVGKCRTFRRDDRGGKGERQKHEPSYFLPVHVRLLGIRPLLFQFLGSDPNCESILASGPASPLRYAALLEAASCRACASRRPP